MRRLQMEISIDMLDEVARVIIEHSRDFEVHPVEDDDDLVFVVVNYVREDESAINQLEDDLNELIPDQED